MKLFIWYKIRCDFTCGIAFAMAENKQEAIQKILEDSASWEIDNYAGELYDNEPVVHEEPFGDWIGGGG